MSKVSKINVKNANIETINAFYKTVTDTNERVAYYKSLEKELGDLIADAVIVRAENREDALDDEEMGNVCQCRDNLANTRKAYVKAGNKAINQSIKTLCPKDDDMRQAFVDMDWDKFDLGILAILETIGCQNTRVGNAPSNKALALVKDCRSVGNFSNMAHDGAKGRVAFTKEVLKVVKAVLVRRGHFEELGDGTLKAIAEESVA